MQNVTAIGPGGVNDYSNWTFIYAQSYHLIDEGTNELTSKIACSDNPTIIGNNSVTTKYYSINVTGVTNTTDPTLFNLTPSVDNSTTIPGFHSIAYSSILPQYSGTNDTVSQPRQLNLVVPSKNYDNSKTDDDNSKTDDNVDISSNHDAKKKGTSQDSKDVHHSNSVKYLNVKEKKWTKQNTSSSNGMVRTLMT
ncbi:MAG: hypothetical protein M3530_05035 [Thermoproteota archaeon]|nr:hypothetical protein [Thermoproteota archaeon]